MRFVSSDGWLMECYLFDYYFMRGGEAGGGVGDAEQQEGVGAGEGVGVEDEVWSFYHVGVDGLAMRVEHL